jgi:hypothetical protein
VRRRRHLPRWWWHLRPCRHWPLGPNRHWPLGPHRRWPLPLWHLHLRRNLRCLGDGGLAGRPIEIAAEQIPVDGFQHTRDHDDGIRQAHKAQHADRPPRHHVKPSCPVHEHRSLAPELVAKFDWARRRLVMAIHEQLAEALEIERSAMLRNQRTARSRRGAAVQGWTRLRDGSGFCGHLVATAVIQRWGGPGPQSTGWPGGSGCEGLLALR